MTFKELREISIIVSDLYIKFPNLGDTKFGYSWKRFYEKNIEKTTQEFQQALTDARIDNALVDPITKAVLLDEKDKIHGGFKFDKDGAKKVSRDEQKIVDEFNAKEIEVTPYISPFVPELNEEQKELLKGILIA